MKKINAELTKQLDVFSLLQEKKRKLDELKDTCVEREKNNKKKFKIN